MERRILRSGRPLSDGECALARRVRVRYPERIRVLTVPAIPFPGPSWLQRLAARCGFDGSQTAGMALRHGIFVRDCLAHDPLLLLHECVHTGQYERAGSLSGFLRPYLVQCLCDNYADSAFEREAREWSAAAAGGLAAGGAGE
jgi:hypothetical protein